MIQKMLISQTAYSIPTILHLPHDLSPKLPTDASLGSFSADSDSDVLPSPARFPAVILCHGTGSHKDEVGNLFQRLADALALHGIASARFDFAGCGDSQAPQQTLTFLGEVSDTKAVYDMLLHHPAIDPQRIGILGFSQGARVMAEFLHVTASCTAKHIGAAPSITTAVSWSGACHNGPGIFREWYSLYYEEAIQNSYAVIPMGWRDDLLVSQQWFDEVRNTHPMEGFTLFSGPVLAIAGTDDAIVPCEHAWEILTHCSHPDSKALILPGADHTFCVLTRDQTFAEQVLTTTTDWFCRHLK